MPDRPVVDRTGLMGNDDVDACWGDESRPRNNRQQAPVEMPLMMSFKSKKIGLGEVPIRRSGTDCLVVAGKGVMPVEPRGSQ